MAAPLARRFLGAHFADLAVMEADLRGSGLDWTVVRPPRLTDQPLTGAYRVTVEHNPYRYRSIGRADVADAMLRAITDATTIQQAIGIGR